MIPIINSYCIHMCTTAAYHHCCEPASAGETQATRVPRPRRRRQGLRPPLPPAPPLPSPAPPSPPCRSRAAPGRPSPQPTASSSSTLPPPLPPALPRWRRPSASTKAAGGELAVDAVVFVVGAPSGTAAGGCGQGPIWAPMGSAGLCSGRPPVRRTGLAAAERWSSRARLCGDARDGPRGPELNRAGRARHGASSSVFPLRRRQTRPVA